MFGPNATISVVPCDVVTAPKLQFEIKTKPDKHQSSTSGPFSGQRIAGHRVCPITASLLEPARYMNSRDPTHMYAVKAQACNFPDPKSGFIVRDFKDLGDRRSSQGLDHWRLVPFVLLSMRLRICPPYLKIRLDQRLGDVKATRSSRESMLKQKHEGGCMVNSASFFGQQCVGRS